MQFACAELHWLLLTSSPAAMKTIMGHLRGTGTGVEDYDLIATGDLGKLGSDILRDICAAEGLRLGVNYHDCGAMIFNGRQRAGQGGSGCACGAVILNSYILDKVETGEFKRVLFVATGALMSLTSFQQGETIPAIAHAVTIERV